MIHLRYGLWPRLVLMFSIAFALSAIAAQGPRSTPPQKVLPEAQQPAKYPDVTRVGANPKQGFLSPYFLFFPEQLQNAQGAHARLLVLPNNTGTVSDDRSVHETAALKVANDWRWLATKLNVGLLVPAFPRPAAQDSIYTHALGRSAMLTEIPQIRRIDLQLIHMIDDARSRQRHRGLRLGKRVLMFGFSASAMFTNRFVFLHPERVQAAAFGSPGGWAIAPASSWKGAALTYPVGVADFKAVTGENFHLDKVAEVPQFLFLGTTDENDSVPNDDSYEERERKLVMDLFGHTLMERWPYTVELYARHLPKAELKLYPGVGHRTPKEVRDDCENFLALHMENR